MQKAIISTSPLTAETVIKNAQKLGFVGLFMEEDIPEHALFVKDAEYGNYRLGISEAVYPVQEAINAGASFPELDS